MNRDHPPDPRPERPSRSEMKRQATAAQELGVELLALPERALDGFPLDDELRAALRDARGMRLDSGRRRQLQRIGTLMRDADVARIREVLEQWRQGGRQVSAGERQAAAWRDALVNGDDGAADPVVAALPGVDRERLLELAQRARDDRAGNHPQKHARELYRLLRDALAARPG